MKKREKNPGNRKEDESLEGVVNPSATTIDEDSQEVLELLLNKPNELTLEKPTVESLVKYIMGKPCTKILVLTGAGISTNCGLPDVRTPKTGIYHNIDSTNVPYPHALFSNEFFKKNPKPFYRMFRTYAFEKYVPSMCHYFISLLNKKEILLRNYTQNMDGLENMAGLPTDKVAQINGCFKSFWCVRCKMEESEDYVREQLEMERIPMCHCGGTIKPRIYFYGEALPKSFCRKMEADFKQCDLLMILGTSLSDDPVAQMVSSVSKNCPRLLINDREISKSLGFHFSVPPARDVLWIGDCDEGCKLLADLLKWTDELKEIIEDSFNMNLSVSSSLDV